MSIAERVYSSIFFSSAVAAVAVDGRIEMGIPRDVFSWNHREGILELNMEIWKIDR